MNKLTVLVSLLLLLSCGSGKFAKLIQEGTVAASSFYVQLPFEYKRNEIFIKVKVNGVPATFMLDTGAPNLITTQFQKQLGLSAVHRQSTSDSRNRSQKLDFVRLEEIELAGVIFNNTAAVVADFSAAPEIACLGLDGFIGANLMRQAFWQINYASQTIIFTDQFEKLNIPPGSLQLGFKENLQGTPRLRLDVTGKQKVKTSMKLDTGSANSLSLNARYLKKIKRPRYRQIGYTSSGLSGAIEDTTFLLQVNEFWLDSVPFTDQMMKGDAKGSNLIGNAFLQNYIVTIDWERKKVILTPNPGNFPEVVRSFGFSVRYGTENLIVSAVIEGSPAFISGLRANDQILEINGTDYSTLAFDDYCRKTFEKSLLPEGEQVIVKVKSGDREWLLETKSFILFAD